MGTSHCLTTSQCEPNMSCISKAHCSSYQAPCACTSIHDDNIRIISEYKPLPSVHETIYSAEESSPKRKVNDIEGPDSSNSIRMSVLEMKSLPPLKLSSSPPNSNSFPSSRLTQRSTFGLENFLWNDASESINHFQPRRRRLRLPRPTTIRREWYRDTPVYTEAGCRSPYLAYYADEELYINSSPAESLTDEFSVIHEYASSCDAKCQGERLLEDFEKELPLPGGASSTTTKGNSRDSDLSFKCLGEKSRTSGLGMSLFRDEAAWLRSPLNRWNGPKEESLPQLLADNMPVERDIEGWLSDTSSDCESLDDLYVRIEIPMVIALTKLNDFRIVPLPLPLPELTSSR